MKRRSGFTLVEVMVAVVVGSLVMFTAYRVFTGVAAGAKALVAAREDIDRSVNARRWLKAAFLSLEPPFEGRVDRAMFTSWQLSAEGWFEPHVVTLSQDGTHFVVESGSQAFQLADSVVQVAFDYLLEPGADTKWVREWISPVSAPLAVRLRITGCGKRDAGCVDTLFFLVKERG